MNSWVLLLFCYAQIILDLALSHSPLCPISSTYSLVQNDVDEVVMTLL